MSRRLFSFSSERFKAIHSYCHAANLSEISAVYGPEIEREIQNKWRREERRTSELQHVFSLILPPPNITGNLHLGHALTVTIQDVIARWKNMRSCDVRWIPGFDHAGVATQLVVERSLLAKSGLTRQELGREKFLEEVWAWKREKGHRISEQICSLGTSLDWTREIFTLDKRQRESVTSALFQLWEDGLIYREPSFVNWCCHLGSVISDIEVTNVDVSGPTPLYLPGQEHPVIFGRIMRFAYLVLGKDDEIVVSTTRPETILGDVAVAIHPSDQRYTHLHGAILQHPITKEAIPLVLDHNVDPNFGSGAVKITPAHNQLDYNIGKKYNLPLKQVINEDGTLSRKCGLYSGLDRWKAREIIIDHLAKKSLLRGIDSHVMRVPTCSRSGDVIELLLKSQWFIKCNEMAEKASSSVKEGRLVLEPEKYNNLWFSWMENIKDWCISRQVWWGHEVPFYCCSHGTESTWLCAMNEEDALKAAQKLFKSSEVTVTRDSDVLDTWFSSALLPFSVHGWPKQTADFRKYFPLSMMVTGNDILFFWVARMVMLSLQLTNQLPFKKVLLHGIVCDNFGRKMSKSKGNVIDPLDVIQGTTKENLKNQVINYHNNGIISKEEVQASISSISDCFQDGIPKCGADALRFTLLTQNVKSTFVNFNLKECYSNKLFCNKIWQATKFVLFWSNNFKVKSRNSNYPLKYVSLMDKWIVNRLSLMIDVVNKSLETNEFHLATASLKSFLYSDFCCIYIECVKPLLKSNNTDDSKIICEVLLFCLEMSLRCLAPFMPHLCEELYNKLPNRSHDSILRCTMPSDLQLFDHELDKNVHEMLSITESIRRMKAESGFFNKKLGLVHVVTEDIKKFEDFKMTIKILSHCLEIKISKDFPDKTNHCLREIINEKTQVLLELQQGYDLSLDSGSSPLKLKLKSKLEKLEQMRLDEGYENVLPAVQKVHSAKILKLASKLKQLEDLENGILKKQNTK